MTGEGGKWWLITPRGRLATSTYNSLPAAPDGNRRIVLGVRLPASKPDGQKQAFAF